jgi:hypothetical protein
LHFGSLHASGDLSDRRRPVLLEEPAFGVCPVRPVNGTAAATCLKSRFVPDLLDGALPRGRCARPGRPGRYSPGLVCPMGRTRCPSADHALVNAGLRRGRGPCWSERGEALTVPPVPCGTFRGWFAERCWWRTFARAAMPGTYLSVVIPRKVRAGDPVAIVDHRAHGVTVAQVFRAITLAPDLLPSILAAEGIQEGTKEMAPRWKGLRAGLGRASQDGSPGSRGMRGRGCADGGARPDRLGTGSRSGCARTWCGR